MTDKNTQSKGKQAVSPFEILGYTEKRLQKAKELDKEKILHNMDSYLLLKVPNSTNYCLKANETKEISFCSAQIQKTPSREKHPEVKARLLSKNTCQECLKAISTYGSQHKSYLFYIDSLLHFEQVLKETNLIVEKELKEQAKQGESYQKHNFFESKNNVNLHALIVKLQAAYSPLAGYYKLLPDYARAHGREYENTNILAFHEKLEEEILQVFKNIRKIYAVEEIIQTEKEEYYDNVGVSVNETAFGKELLKQNQRQQLICLQKNVDLYWYSEYFIHSFKKPNYSKKIFTKVDGESMYVCKRNATKSFMQHYKKNSELQKVFQSTNKKLKQILKDFITDLEEQMQNRTSKKYLLASMYCVLNAKWEMSYGNLHIFFTAKETEVKNVYAAPCLIVNNYFSDKEILGFEEKTDTKDTIETALAVPFSQKTYRINIAREIEK